MVLREAAPARPEAPELEQRSSALVVGGQGPNHLGVCRGKRSDRDELAAAVLDSGVLQFVVLAFGVELDARTNADIFRNLRGTDGLGQGFRVAGAGPFVGLRSYEQRLECIYMIRIHIDARVALCQSL